LAQTHYQLDVRPLHVLHLALSVACVIAVAGCQKTATPLAAPKPTEPKRAITPIEPTSFDQVTRHLDPGGSLYVYLSTESFLQRFATEAARIRKLLVASQAHTSPNPAQLDRYWASLTRVATDSGIADVTGFGISSIAIAPAQYRTKWVIHHYEGKGTGFLWQLNGNSATALEIIPYLPAHTAVTSSGNFSFEPIWKAIGREAAHSPELRLLLDAAADAVRKSSGLDLDALIAGVGPACAVVITLDESRMTTVPTGDGASVTIPEPAIALMVEVRDPALLARLEHDLAAVPAITTADLPEAKMRIVGTPLPLPFLRPAVAWTDRAVFVASNDQLIRDMFDAKSGRKAGFAATDTYKMIAQDLPKTAVQFHLLHPLFVKTVADVQTTALKRQIPDPQLFEEFLKSMGPDTITGPVWGFTEKGAEGYIGTSYGYRGQNGADALVMGAGIAPAAMLSAIAVPSFQRARKRAQATQVLEDLRLLDAAQEQYAIEHNKHVGDPVTFADLQHYLKHGSRLYTSQGRDVLGNPFTITVTGTLPKVNPATANHFSDAVTPDFWTPYR
jgi:Tfp pilus assembly protein PilE